MDVERSSVEEIMQTPIGEIGEPKKKRGRPPGSGSNARASSTGGALNTQAEESQDRPR